MQDLPSIVETYLATAGFKAAAAALAKEKTKTTAVRAPSQTGPPPSAHPTGASRTRTVVACGGVTGRPSAFGIARSTRRCARVYPRRSALRSERRRRIVRGSPVAAGDGVARHVSVHQWYHLLLPTPGASHGRAGSPGASAA
jgi:hypothetical protein